MKYSFLLIIVFFLSCNIESQNNEKKELSDSILISAKPVEYTTFILSKIEDISKDDNERSPNFIKTRIEQLIGESYKQKCLELNVVYPPKFVLFRAFKLEGEFEIWVADKRSDSLKLLANIPICAIDQEPGPKLMQGDGKTPEGFYTCRIYYGSPNSFMWIKLNNNEINDFGSVGYGSSFKLCLEYPLTIDTERTKRFSPGHNPGSAICVHGNCVTAGCISFENKNFLPVFLSSCFHDSKLYGYPKIHIFPFRFSDVLIEKYSEQTASFMNKAEITVFWNEIRKAYDLFNINKKALKISYQNNTYNFTEY